MPEETVIPAVAPQSKVYNLTGCEKFLNVMRTQASVIKFDSAPFEYPAQTDTVVTHSDLLEVFPIDILNYRIGRFLVIVGPRPAENHPKLGNFAIYSTKFPGLTVYSRKRAAK